MSVLAVSIDEAYWQKTMIKLLERGVQLTHVSTSYNPKKKSVEFYEKFNGKAVDINLFFRLDSITKLVPADAPALGKAELDYFEHIERDFYILTDRYNFFPKSFRYRKRLFRQNLRFWLHYLPTEGIKTVFFTCTPHNLGNYALLHVAKYLGLKTVIIAHTMLNDHVLMRYDYREALKVPADFMEGKSPAEIAAAIPEKLFKAASADSSYLNFWGKYNRVSAGVEDKKIIPKKTDGFFVKEKYNNPITRFNFSTEYKKRGALYMDDPLPKFLKKLVKKYDLYNQKKIAEYVSGISVKPDLSEKYIYFAMHLQPERTSTPEAECFEDHLLAIDILARALPEGWKLYVKEYPMQFEEKINYLKAHHMRDKFDYQQILRNPNTVLISQELKTPELIKNAQLVSTLSGSVGWESLKASKPCLIFANAWYSASRSCYRIASLDDAKKAIAAACKKSEEEAQLDMLKYLAFMQEKLFVGNLGDNDEIIESTTTLSYEELMDSMVDRLEKEFV